MIVALKYSLKSGKLIPPAPFFFVKIALTIWGFFLCFHTNCEMFCSSSVKNAIGRDCIESIGKCIIMINMYNQILIRNKKAQATDTSNSTDESQLH